MKFYHGTTEEYWEEIQKEGVLWGRKNVKWEGRLLSRVTWLAVKKEHAGLYDDRGITDEKCVLLEVDMPEIIGCHSWQTRVYEPIPINQVKRIN